MTQDVSPSLAALSPPASVLRDLFSFLAPAPVARAWCGDSDARRWLGDAFRCLATTPDAEPAPAAWQEAFDELAALCSAGETPAALRFSPETLAAVRNQIPAEHRTSVGTLALQWIDALTPEDSDDPTTWELIRALEPHILAVLEFGETADIAHPTGFLAGQKLGVYYFTQGSYEKARTLMQRGLELNEAHFGPNHPTVAVDLNNITFLKELDGRTAEIMPLRIRVVEILRLHQDSEPQKYATALVNLANLLFAQNHPTEAEALYRQALDFEKEKLGEDDVTVARDLRNLSDHLAKRQRWEAAEELAIQALAIDEASRGVHHPNIAADLRTLASIRIRSNRPGGVDILLQRILEIDLEWHPAGSARVLNDRLALADFFGNQERIAEATRVYEDIIQVYETHTVPATSPLIVALFKVALAASAEKDFSKAITLLRRALPLAEKEFGVDDTQTGTIRQALVDFLRANEAWTEARAILLDDQEAHLRAAIGAHPEAAEAHNQLGLFLKNERRDYAVAVDCYRKAIELDPTNNSYVSNLALLLTTVRGEHDEAEALYRRAIELNPRDGTTIGNLASLVHNVRRRFEEAAQLYQMALDTTSYLPSVRANYAILLWMQGQQAEAQAQLEAAWKENKGQHDRYSARTFFLKAAFARLHNEDPNDALGRLKVLFTVGIPHAPWDARVFREFLSEQLDAEELAFFMLLADAIGDTDALQKLETEARWQALAPVELDAPWDPVTAI